MAKATKKKTTKKKKTVKKRKKMGVSIIRQYNREVPFEMNFVLSDGRRLKNIFELIDCLDNMSNDIFSFHVNNDKNDFSNWLEGVLDERELAGKIKKLTGKIETQNALLKHLITKLK